VSIVIKGAGEMASGIAHRLYTAGMTRICMIEIDASLCVRRTVSFCEALVEGQVVVEGVTGTRVRDLAELNEAWEQGRIGVMADPDWKFIAELKPDVVVDAILAKRNLGTVRGEAQVVIGVGPGFSAPNGVHAVIESNRGPDLGQVIYKGETESYTGIPGVKAGYRWERVLRAPHAGTVRHLKSIGDPVKAGDTVLYVDETPVTSAIDGILRGCIREIKVGKDEKVGDIEPGNDPSCCRAISDKAKAVGNGVLEAIRKLLKD
jgi:xanthine dehydrogenase accessory factor